MAMARRAAAVAKKKTSPALEEILGLAKMAVIT
jgi:hypothetical protein